MGDLVYELMMMANGSKEFSKELCEQAATAFKEMREQLWTLRSEHAWNPISNPPDFDVSVLVAAENGSVVMAARHRQEGFWTLCDGDIELLEVKKWRAIPKCT